MDNNSTKSPDGRLLVLTELEKDTLVRMQKDPSKANIDAWSEAGKKLAEFLGDGDKEPSFANRIEALEWLQRQGYKVAKSKLYADCKKGLLKLRDDGSVFESDLKKYARKAALNKLSETPEVDSGDLQVQKVEAEIEKLRSQNKLLQVQLDEKLRKYIIRSDFEMEFAARVAVLKSGIEHMVYSYAFEWTALVLAGGKDSATQRLIDGMKQVVKKQFNDFANIKNFEVVFAKEELTEDLTTESTEGTEK